MDNLDQNQLAQVQQSMSADQFEVAHMLGQAQFAEFVEKVSAIGRIKLWAHLKETKKYKGLMLIDVEGNRRHVGTWEEFCQSQGKSRSAIDEDIQNLNTFGEEFLEQSKKIGLTSRDLRQLRKLPQEDQTVLINGEEVKNADRESLLEILDDMSAKHAKEKAERDAKIATLESDKDALETVLQKKDQKMNEMDTKISKLESPAEIKRRAESEPQALEKAALDTLSTESILFLTAFNRYINAVGGVLDIAAEKELAQLYERVDESIVATAQRFAQYIQSLGVEIDFAEMIHPSWMFPEECRSASADLAPVAVEEKE